MGKTAAGMGIAVHAAIGTGEERPVGIFSLEMTRVQLMLRMLCAHALVDLSRILRGGLQDDDYVRLNQAAYVTQAPLYIDDTGGLTLTQVRARARRMKAEHPDLAMIVVDYIQLMNADADLIRDPCVLHGSAAANSPSIRSSIKSRWRSRGVNRSGSPSPGSRNDCAPTSPLVAGRARAAAAPARSCTDPGPGPVFVVHTDSTAY